MNPYSPRAIKRRVTESHRRYSPRSVAHVEPFGFNASTDRPGMVVYNITFQDMSWPEELSPNVAA